MPKESVNWYENFNNIWGAFVDNKTWKVSLMDLEGDRFSALLVLTKVEEDIIVHSEKVALSQSAYLGPSPEDIEKWQARTIELIEQPGLRGIYMGEPKDASDV